MLRVKEAGSPPVFHDFELTGEDETGDKKNFILTSPTYAGATINFSLESDIYPVAAGYTVSVHLFKNSALLQGDIVDLRINGLANNSGKIGYFFRLDALLEPGTIMLTQHTFSYAYYALRSIFSNGLSLQTKEPELTATPPKITDFFDDDTIVLVVCNEYSAAIVNFSIWNYLPNLYLFGFTKFKNGTPIESLNNSNIINTKYGALKNPANLNGEGFPVLRVSSYAADLAGEGFIGFLYEELLQKRNEEVTRFVILYQTIEILISKILHLEIQSGVCNNLAALTSTKLKRMLNKLQSEGPRIELLHNKYTAHDGDIQTELIANILDFFTHINDAEYSDPARNATMTLTDMFYDYRNKLVHNYRQIHLPGINEQLTKTKMETINKTTELYVSHLITQFHT